MRRPRSTERSTSGELAVLGDLQSDTFDALREVRVVHAVRAKPLRELVLREDPAQVRRGTRLVRLPQHLLRPNGLVLRLDPRLLRAQRLADLLVTKQSLGRVGGGASPPPTGSAPPRGGVGGGSLPPPESKSSDSESKSSEPSELAVRSASGAPVAPVASVAPSDLAQMQRCSSLPPPLKKPPQKLRGGKQGRQRASYAYGADARSSSMNRSHATRSYFDSAPDSRMNWRTAPIIWSRSACGRPFR